MASSYADLLCWERRSYREAPTQVLAPVREENADLYFPSTVELKQAGRVVRTNAAGLGDSKVGVCRELWALWSPPFTGCMFNAALVPLCGVYGLA